MAKVVNDSDGFIEIKSNKLSKPGVFDYLGSEIGAPIPDKVYRVYRPQDEIRSKECVNSFKLQPWIITHTMLQTCLLYTSPSPRDGLLSRMPSSA